MTQAVFVDTKIIKQILQRLDDLAKDVAVIKEKVSEEPAYGSDGWWELSDKKARDDIQNGRYTVIRDAKSLQAHLDSLKKS